MRINKAIKRTHPRWYVKETKNGLIVRGSVNNCHKGETVIPETVVALELNCSNTKKEKSIIILPKTLKSLKVNEYNNTMPSIEKYEYKNGYYIGTRDNKYEWFIGVVDPYASVELHYACKHIAYNALNAFENINVGKNNKKPQVILNEKIKLEYGTIYRIIRFIKLNSYENGMYIGTPKNPYKWLIDTDNGEYEIKKINPRCKIISNDRIKIIN